MEESINRYRKWCNENEVKFSFAGIAKWLDLHPHELVKQLVKNGIRLKIDKLQLKKYGSELEIYAIVNGAPVE